MLNFNFCIIMKEAIKAVYDELRANCKDKPNKMLTRKELSDYLKRLADAVLSEGEDNDGKLVTKEEILLLFNDLTDKNELQKLVSREEVFKL